MNETITRLEGEVRQLRAALAVYADPENWASGYHEGPYHVWEFAVTRGQVPYEQAQRALKGNDGRTSPNIVEVQ